MFTQPSIAWSPTAYPNVPVVGDRAGSRRIERPEAADVFAAVDELVARRLCVALLDGLAAEATS